MSYSWSYDFVAWMRWMKHSNQGGSNRILQDDRRALAAKNGPECIKQKPWP